MVSKKTTDTQENGTDSSPDLISFEIKKAREQSKMSVLELSAKTGISKTVLHGYERGRTKPGARELRLLCEAMGVSPNRLLFGLDDYNAPRSGIAHLIKLSRSNPLITQLFSSMVFPMVFARLDENEAESLMVLIGSLLHAKDPEQAEKLFVMIETVSKHFDSYYKTNEPNKPPSPEMIEKMKKEIEAKFSK